MSDDNLLREADQYMEGLFVPTDDALQSALKDASDGGLPQINVSPCEGKLLYLLAKMNGAKRILEIGTLGGFSTIWLARALPSDGGMISLELSEHHAKVARRNVERAGLSRLVEIRVGAAMLSLDAMISGGEKPFDLIFVDADKENYPGYLERAFKLVRSGSIILADNTLKPAVWQGRNDPYTNGIRNFNEMLARDPRVETIIVPIVRHSLDGLAIARVK
ncbi:MAG TPA: O-methyltransferase [Planctomycetota bacterium]|nr:O-methyltransferase [Planctomycetota bacterium]